MIFPTGNPAPAHGGRTCVGPDRLEMYCSNLPPCPEPRNPPKDGGWGPFGSWSKCTTSCGGGFRLRRRNCDNPSPQHGGIECSGCSIDYETCNTHKCPEKLVLGQWTPWLQQNTSTSNEHMEIRFRYSCKFNGTDARVSKSKVEKRICSNGTCIQITEDDKNFEQGEQLSWSGCTTNCGVRQQYRYKGSNKMLRTCNTQPCEGLWQIQFDIRRLRVCLVHSKDSLDTSALNILSVT